MVGGVGSVYGRYKAGRRGTGGTGERLLATKVVYGLALVAEVTARDQGHWWRDVGRVPSIIRSRVGVIITSCR